MTAPQPVSTGHRVVVSVRVLCEVCHARPAVVLVVVGEDGFRVCVECAADGVQNGAQRREGELS